MMVMIVKKQLMVFVFLQVITHKAGEHVDDLFYFHIIKAWNKGGQQLVPAEEFEKEGQRMFIG
jgi:hypothetical protein